MVGFGDELSAGMEGPVSAGGSSDRQVANAYIHPCDTRMGFRCGVYYLNLQGDQQIELFLRFVVPEPGGSNMCAPLEQGAMLGIRGVRHNHPPAERQDAYLMIGLQTIIPLIVIRQGRGDILGGLVQALVALLGQTSFTSSGILPNLCPERLIGSPNLAGDVGCHLGRQFIGSTCLGVRFIAQAYLVAHLAIRESIPTHPLEPITIVHLRSPQAPELATISMQFK